jgi:hypothetical protein
MKKILVTFVVGFTAIILPSIASAENAVAAWNPIAVTTALAGNNGAIVQPTPKSGRAIVPCLPPIDLINEGRHPKQKSHAN